MPDGILSAVTETAKAAAEIASAVKQRDAEKNTPNERSNAQAADLQKVRDAAAKAEQSPDTTAIDKLTQA